MGCRARLSPIQNYAKCIFKKKINFSNIKQEVQTAKVVTKKSEKTVVITYDFFCKWDIPLRAALLNIEESIDQWIQVTEIHIHTHTHGIFVVDNYESFDRRRIVSAKS